MFASAALATVRPHLLKIAIVGAIFLLILGIFMRGEASGRNKAMVDGLQRKLKNVERANETELEISRMPDTAVTDELYSDWTRD